MLEIDIPVAVMRCLPLMMITLLSRHRQQISERKSGTLVRNCKDRKLKCVVAGRFNPTQRDLCLASNLIRMTVHQMGQQPDTFGKINKRENVRRLDIFVSGTLDHCPGMHGSLAGGLDPSQIGSVACETKWTRIMLAVAAL
jgi:hypothetical protein